ncbi:hypothetical protein [Dactylosporangium sp. NPDC000521]|uniref:hypothetical protein n=1 Tax=Dactylosporangium sp. NPDC000521 TaxID=3363975 RepID=UPI0036BE6E7B
MDHGKEEFYLERYRFILQQLNTSNEALYRFLAIYQTLVTALTASALGVFVGYRSWNLDPSVARAGILGLLSLTSLIAVFTILMIFIGVLAWLDYRKEECELTDDAVSVGFRSPPKVSNWKRWHETYVGAFVALSNIVLWVLFVFLVLPSVK